MAPPTACSFLGAVALAAACGGAPAPARTEPPDPDPPSDPGPPAALSLAEPCIDAAADADSHFESDYALVPYEEPLDLDGDDVDDLALTALEAGGSGGAAYRLYVVRGSCARFVGELVSMGIGVRHGSGHAGLADLDLLTQAGSCDQSEMVARFDGQRYHVVRNRRCTCAAGCGPWSATPRTP